MNRALNRTSLLFSLLLVGGCAVLDSPAPPAPIAAHAAAWDGDPRYWSFEDGVIVGESTADRPLEKSTYLVWRGQPLGDFELRFQVRIVGGNSGVQFRSREIGPWDVHGYQADLDAADQWTGCLYEQGGRGVLATRGRDVRYDAADVRHEDWLPGAEGGVELPSRDATSWIDYRIRAVGEEITLEVNGVRTLRFADASSQRAVAGGLALQLHEGPPMRVEYRNFVLQELACTPQEAVPQGTPAKEATAGERPFSASRWIWAGEGHNDERVWLGREFRLESLPERAELFAACDNSMKVHINGERVVSSDEWEHPVRIDVLDALQLGANRILVEAKNQDGPAGLLLSLETERQGETERLVSDSRWWSSLSEPESERSGERPAHELGAYGCSPWGTLSEPAAPRVSEALAAEAITLPAGFAAELLYSVPRAEQGSWVSLCAADDGTLYASDQYGALYHITLGQELRVEAVPIDLGEAHGLLWAFDSLYAVVSGSDNYDSGLYRARDTDADGELDAVEALATFDGNGEHGPHAVVLGPDGNSLYVVAGNHVDLLPTAASRVPEVWDEDLPLPRIEDPNGHAVGIRAPGGWIAKTDPAGASFELIAVGMRNAYDLAFDGNGELFTFDSDMEWDIGLPWYRPARVLHVTSGAEFGWRSGSGKWPTYSPDSLPAVVDVGLASPTGVAMGTRSGFPAPWRHSLFAADWAYGTIYAVQLEPDGATFRGTAEPFATGKPLPVTDMAVAGDGALYFTTGGRRAQSGLYRVTWEGATPGEGRTAPPTPESKQRRKLEALHGAPSAGAIDHAWPQLASLDRHVRFAARTAIEFQPVSAWRERALEETHPQRAIEALLALTRCDPELSAGEFAQALARWDWKQLQPDQLLGALRVVGIGAARIEGLSQERAEIESRLLELVPTGDSACDAELIQLLAGWNHPAVIPMGLARIESAASQQDAIQAAYALSVVRTGWDEESRARLLAWFDLTAPDYEGGVSFQSFLDEIRRRASNSMGVSLLAESSPSDAQFAPSAPLPFVRNYVEDDLVELLDGVGEGRNFERGQELYRQASCLQCHRIAGNGGATGPDLTGVASRYSPRDLLDSLLEPSRTISDQYREWEVWSENGTVSVGRIVSETTDAVVVREATGRRIEIAADSVTLKRESPLSRMPSGLLNALEEEQILDLLAYVLAGGDPSDSAYPTPGLAH